MTDAIRDAFPATGMRGVLSDSMPRWFFLLFAIALGLSVVGGVLIFLRSPTPVEQLQN
ncbi:hypothetical protein [Methylobacterium sp. Leaf111]|jgi:hypothetical protein|uniref:hypothetical protein n=1 Tax=Methylobacterium sp. Leaf111 TaxID=1736257 RepID=UPI000A764A4B|nr:hypothetical protein [Methylobacterium sp. Leaf111]